MRHVIGTAGHVDHGKSSLVRALTGTDPDRLVQERRRGMSIELGFAEWRLPSGGSCGIVDVPGHQRFVATMVAGAAGIDLALLVVAADDGVMPQTREHLEICELLGVRGMVVVLSRSDLADADTTELAREEVAGLLDGGRFRGAPAVTCSSTSGEGLETLAHTVDAALAALPPRRDRGRPRLFIDRAFSLPGFGPVVTGTLEGGSLGEGDAVQLLPGGLRARVRGLQHHGEQVGSAEPGARTAVNLAGVERQALARGMAVVRPDTMATSRRIDAWLRCARSAPAPIGHGTVLDLHLGTAETRARVWLLDGAELEPGAEGAAQLSAERPLVAAPGDRLVLRRPSPAATLGGGEVLDISPRRHRRNDAATGDALRRRRGAGPATLVVEELDKHRAWATRRQLALATGCGRAELDEVLGSLGERAVALGDRVLAATRWAALREHAIAVLDAEHAADPLRRGIQREQWRERLHIPEAVCADLVRQMVAAGEVEEDTGLVARRGRGEQLPARARDAVEAVMATLEDRGLDAASLSDLAPKGMTPAVLRHLIERRRAVRIGSDLVLAATSCERAEQLVVRHLQANGAATVSELRDLLGITRRTAVPLLEHLDRGGITARDGDVRRLRPTRSCAT